MAVFCDIADEIFNGTVVNLFLLRIDSSSDSGDGTADAKASCADTRPWLFFLFCGKAEGLKDRAASRLNFPFISSTGGLGTSGMISSMDCGFLRLSKDLVDLSNLNLDRRYEEDLRSKLLDSASLSFPSVVTDCPVPFATFSLVTDSA